MHPVLFHLSGGAPVYAYGFMLGLAVVVGWNLSIVLAARGGLDAPRVAWGAGVIALLAILGSRLLHLIVNPAEWAHPAAWLDFGGGIVAYGGFLGGTLGAGLAFARTPAGFLRYADVVSPGVALGIGLTRIGCFLNGCDFGMPTARAWGVRFPRDRVLGPGLPVGWSPAWEQHYRTGASLGGETVTAASAWSLPVHPTQLYESALGLALFVLLLALRRRRPFPGAVFLALVAGYGLGRAAIEAFRGDALRGLVLGLPTSQFLGLATAALALSVAITLRGRHPSAVG